MTKLLLLCAGSRDLRELAAAGLDVDHDIYRRDYGTAALEEMVSHGVGNVPPLRSPRDEIADILRRYRGCHLDGVISTDDYPGSTLASIVARELGLPGVDPVADLTCQHKYLSRVAQAKAMPDAVPRFARIGRSDARGDIAWTRYPAFVKPVKSFFSIGARRVDTADALHAAIAANPIPSRFLEPLDWFLHEFVGTEIGEPLIVEELLPGNQATLDGFVSNGHVRSMGVVDSIMFPGTISFQRFEYPSALPEAIQQRMAAASRAVLASIGFDNGMFNIEFMHDPATDALRIIEINPRMSSQFADLYEKVDGYNPYRILVDLALGNEPAVSFRQGRHAMAASCVLRTFADREVLRVPTSAEVASLCRRYPDLRVEILAAEGCRLSDTMQDDISFRYGLVNIGGANQREILTAFEACRQALPFTLLPPGYRKSSQSWRRALGRSHASPTPASL